MKPGLSGLFIHKNEHVPMSFTEDTIAGMQPPGRVDVKSIKQCILTNNLVVCSVIVQT